MQERPPAHQGAFAEEVGESRIGLQTGFLGASNVTRIFRVYTASRSDNPVQTIENLFTRNGGLKIGSTFPTTGGWGDGSYVLFNFTILDHWIGTNVWILQANYVPSYIAAIPTEQWTMQIQSSLETEHVFTDLDGKGIGTPRYLPYSSSTPSSFTATNINRDPPTVSLELPGGGTDEQSPLLPRFLVGTDRPKRTSVVSISKTISSLLPYLPALRAAMNSQKSVNSDSVTIATTAGPVSLVDRTGIGTLMLMDVLATPIENQTGGLVPSYRISMTLKYDPGFRMRFSERDERYLAPWQYHRVHMHKWVDDGTESPVLKDGRPIVESFKINGETSLTDIIGGFR
jgi:hypothetical protein